MSFNRVIYCVLVGLFVSGVAAAGVPQAASVFSWGGAQNGNNPSFIPLDNVASGHTLITGTNSLTTSHYYSFSEFGKSGFFTGHPTKHCYAPGFWYFGSNANNIILFGYGTSNPSADSASAPTGDNAPQATNNITVGSTVSDWVWYPLPISVTAGTQPYIKLLSGTASNSFRAMMTCYEK